MHYTHLEVQARRLAAIAVTLQASKILGELENVVRVPGEVHPAVLRQPAVVRHLAGGFERQAGMHTHGKYGELT